MNITSNNAHIVTNDIFIDHWSENHNKEDQIIDTFEWKLKMKNFSGQKYLGFFISQDGSNIKNIEDNRHYQTNTVPYSGTGLNVE